MARAAARWCRSPRTASRSERDWQRPSNQPGRSALAIRGALGWSQHLLPRFARRTPGESTMPRVLLVGALAAVLAATGCSPAPAPLSERVAAFEKLPDWSGIWEPNVFVGEGIGQALSPEGLK